MATTNNYPSKLYYSISDVAKITGVKAHVLRYWESEFPSLKPRKPAPVAGAIAPAISTK